eukprot:6469927-Amphidinium_carterae.1
MLFNTRQKHLVEKITEVEVPESRAKRLKVDPGHATEKKWKAQHAVFKAQQKVPIIPWSGSMEGINTERVRDLIHTTHSCLLAQGHRPEDFFVDVSQSLSRSPWCSTLRTLTTSSTYFSFAKGGIVHPSAHLRVLGLNFEGTYSASAYKFLAGEAMAAPCVALASMALLMSLPHCWE